MHKFCSEGADAIVSIIRVNNRFYGPNHPHSELGLDIQFAKDMAQHVFHSTERGLWGTEALLPLQLNQERIPETAVDRCLIQ